MDLIEKLKAKSKEAEKKKNKVRSSIFISDETYKKVREIAERYSISFSDCFEILLEEGIRLKKQKGGGEKK